MEQEVIEMIDELTYLLNKGLKEVDEKKRRTIIYLLNPIMQYLEKFYKIKEEMK